MNIGDHFSYIGGSFTLTPDKIDKAIEITKKELKGYQERLHLWENSPDHPSFAHDMKWHGFDTIDMLVRNHVDYAENQLRNLKKLSGSQLIIQFD